MCVIIHAPAGKSVPFKYLQDAWEQNPHGAGFCYTTTSGRVVAVKGLMSLKSLVKRLLRHPTDEVDISIHFRWATSGLKNRDNTHPWVIGSKLAVVHNGIFSHVKDEPEVSDTGVWVRDFVGRLHDAGLVQHLAPYIERDAGSWNKVIIHEEGFAPLILNEKAGTWKDGIWYSNENFGGPFQKYRYYGSRWEDDYDYDPSTKAWSRKDARAVYVPTKYSVGEASKTTVSCGSTKYDLCSATGRADMLADNIKKNRNKDVASFEDLDAQEYEAWQELAWDRKQARELRELFDKDEDSLGLSELQQLAEYCDNGIYYFPSMTATEVGKMKERAEWLVIFELERMKKIADDEKAKSLDNPGQSKPATMMTVKAFCDMVRLHNGKLDDNSAVPDGTIVITNEEGLMVATFEKDGDTGSTLLRETKGTETDKAFDLIVEEIVNGTEKGTAHVVIDGDDAALYRGTREPVDTVKVQTPDGGEVNIQCS
jgi:hypothetical protein